jgi:hypothetical protein
MRTLQEWLGHRDFKTTLIYADYQPAKREADLIEQAFGGHPPGIKLSASEPDSEQEITPEQASEQLGDAIES